jgi:hypothetical protein
MNLPQEVERRRTFAIVSHPDAGKTTLTEKLLLFGGAIQLAGTVKGRKAARHATSDWMRLEQQRGISVTSSVMQFPDGGCVVNLLDTPDDIAKKIKRATSDSDLLPSENVSCLQHRIVEQADRDVFCILAGRLVLELRHALDPAHPRDAVEDPAELSVRQDGRLREDDRLVRIDAGREISRGDLARLGREQFRILRHGDGVQVDDAENAGILVLHCDELDQRTEIIPEMERT